MNFLADENVDKPIVERLRKDGHVVLYVIAGEIGVRATLLTKIGTSQERSSGPKVL